MNASSGVTGNARLAPWICLRTLPRLEDRAVAHLSKHTEVYFPRCRILQQTQYVNRYITEPLFPQYIFARVELPQAWARRDTRWGLEGPMRFGEEIPKVDDSIIVELRERERTNGLIDLTDPLKIGQVVEILTGPFVGYHVQIVDFNSADARVVVLCDMLGRQHRFEFPREELRISA